MNKRIKYLQKTSNYNYLSTLFTDKLKSGKALTKSIISVIDKVYSLDKINERGQYEEMTRRHLVELMNEDIDTSSVESLAEGLESMLNELISGMKVIENKLDFYIASGISAETANSESAKLIQQLFTAKIIRANVGYPVKKPFITPQIFQREMDMSLTDVVVDFLFEWDYVREYIHNMFYGLRDGEFPYERKLLPKKKP